jgi:hypothetical protein
MSAWFIVIILCAVLASEICIEVSPPVAPFYTEDDCLNDGLHVYLTYRAPPEWRPTSYRCEERPLER